MAGIGIGYEEFGDNRGAGYRNRTGVPLMPMVSLYSATYQDYVQNLFYHKLRELIHPDKIVL